MDINYIDFKEKLYQSLNELRTEKGLFRASLGQLYVNYTWWRDNFYCCLPYLKDFPDKYLESYHCYLDIFITYEEQLTKFSSMINEPNNIGFHYLHPRVNIDGTEIWNTEWGYKQNDAVGYMLIGIYLGEKKSLHIIRNQKDRWIIQLIIDYLIALKYWETADSGAWEEIEEVRASSIGICYRAMINMKELGFIVPDYVLNKSVENLYKLLPYETSTRFCDLALLFLPFLNITNDYQTKNILNNTHLMLEREHGIIRYIGDKYYSSDYSNIIGNEAEWVFGFAYLAAIYLRKNNLEKGKYYLFKIINSWKDGKIPELVYANSTTSNPIPNDNRPLAWACAMTIVAINTLIYNEELL